MIAQTLVDRFYNDARFDGTKRFYDWIREHANRNSNLLNLGAGPATENPVRILKGEVASVTGADVDRCVLGNPEFDQIVLIENGAVPLASDVFDLVFSDYVLEHVERPEEFLREVHRLLKPGGMFFFRTPNLWHYVPLISRATPHRLHLAIANKARALPADAQEPWPTFYRMNTRGRLQRMAVECGFRDVELRMIECEPAYLKFHTLPFLAGVLYERAVNAFSGLAPLRGNIFGCFVK